MKDNAAFDFVRSEVFRSRTLVPNPCKIATNHETNHSDRVFFATNQELWSTDGTESGTVRLTNFTVTEPESAPKYVTEFNGDVYFTVNDGFHGRELYRLPLEDLTPLPGDADGSGTVDFADFLYSAKISVGTTMSSSQMAILTQTARLTSLTF